MQNLTKLRKNALWLLSLFAVLLAFATPASAWKDARLVGDKYGNWEWKNSSVTFDGNENSTITKTVYNWQGGAFKIVAPWDDETGAHWYSTSSNSATTMESGKSYSLSEGGDNNNISLPAEATGKDVTFTLTTGSGKEPKTLTASWSGGVVNPPVASVPSSLYFRSNYYNNNWDETPKIMTKSDDGKKFSFTLSNYPGDKEFYFHFREKQDNWNGVTVFPENDATEASVGTQDAKRSSGSDPNKAWKFNSESNMPVTLTVDFTDAANPKLIVAQEGLANQDGYFLAAGFLGNWAKDQRKEFLPVSEDNDKVLAVTVKYGESNSNNKGFKITTKRTADNGTWYSRGGDRMIMGDTYSIANKTEGGNMYLHLSAVGKDVTFTLTLGDDMKPSTLKAEWEGTEVEITNDMPVYPVGVYSDDALLKYDKWPVLYLKGRVLNDERITPEYQMNKVDDNTYELEFTARNTNTSDKYYSWWDQKYQVVGFENAHSAEKNFGEGVSLNLKDHGKKDFALNEGARFKATCKKQSDGSWKLTLDPVDVNGDGVANADDVNVMPFLSMMGGEWKQRTNATTPFTNKDGNKTKNTNQGWQEAWVQYDNRGQLLLDRNGNVMYNTMWPPKNPILFKSEFELNGSKKDFTLTSKDLAMTYVATKTGKEWKNDDNFKNYLNEHLDNNNRYEHVGKLALDDNRMYTLYRVDDMWINGKVKIWSGWGGVTRIKSDDNKDMEAAIWTTHSNWGHYGKSTDPVKIQPDSSVPLFNENGDVIFEAPTFFKHVNFFYDCEDPNGQGRSVFFTERSFGGAQIAALSSHEYTKGNYQASLANIDSSVKDGKIKKVVISSYSTTQDGDNAVDELVSRVFEWNASDSDNVKPADFHTLFNSQSSNEELPGGGSFNDPASTSMWVMDSYKYQNGDYFYRMTVVLDDTNGTEHSVTVDSNPFTIFNTVEEISLNVYQLVKIKDEEKNGKRVGLYYTYKADVNDATKPTLPAYELTITNDDKFDGTVADGNSNFNYDPITGEILDGYVDDTNYEFTFKSLDELPDYTADCRFTDKVLIVGSVPSAKSVNGYAYGAQNANTEEAPASVRANGPAKAPMTEDYDQSCQRPEYGDRFMHVTNIGTFDAREFTLKMQYSTSFLDADGNLVSYDNVTTEPATADYVAVVPEPQLREAHIDVFYGSDNTEKTDDYVAPFKFRDLPLDLARYHSVRDHIEIEMPNVSNFLKQRMIDEDFFSIKIENDPTVNDGRPDEVVWSNVFDFDTSDDDKPFFEESSEIENNDDNLNVVTIHGYVLPPNMFQYDRNISLLYSAEQNQTETDPTKQKYNYYPRWKDGKIYALNITDNAPINLKHEVKNPEIWIDQNNPKSDGRHLYAKFTLNIKHADDYVPSDPANSLDAAERDKHNYIFSSYQDSNEDGTLKFNEDGSPATVDEYHHLHHHSDKDYYYITIIDKKAHDENSGHDSGHLGDDDDYIVSTDGLLLSNASSNGEACKYAVTADKLLNGGYYPVTITKDFGSVDDKTVVNGGYEYLNVVNKQATDYLNSLDEQIDVLVSYLYPFQDAKEVETPSSKPGMNRVVSDLSSSVIKSQAARGNIDAAIGDIVTSVDQIAGDYGYVKTGAGYVEVEGNGVQVINAAGVLVGEGAGRHDVAAGVYVVRYNGKTVKVVVR